jgi:hypothetical protein
MFLIDIYSWHAKCYVLCTIKIKIAIPNKNKTVRDPGWGKTTFPAPFHAAPTAMNRPALSRI